MTVTRLNGETLGTPLVTAYTYDAAGNLNATTQPNGVTTDHGYDPLNRLTDVLVTDGQGDKLFEQAYTLHDGQRDSVVEKRYDGTSATPFSTVTIDWTYDTLNRLVGESYDSSDDAKDFTDGYTLDLVGNRLGKVHDAAGTANDETATSTYNARDQLTATDSTINANESYDQKLWMVTAQ